MKWFRFYHEAVRDPKVQSMRPELFKFWINFLCVASESEERGVVRSVDHLCYATGLTRNVVGRYCSELEANGLLHRRTAEGPPKDRRRTAEGPVEDWCSFTGSLVPHNWKERQPDSDDSAKRKRNQRSKTCDDSIQQMSRDTSRDSRGVGHGTVTVLEGEGEGERENPPFPPPPTTDPPGPHPERDSPSGNPGPIPDPDEDLEPFHSPPVPATASPAGDRSGQDLADWTAAVEFLRGGEKTAALAGDAEIRADDPEVRGLEGWRFIQAARVVCQAGKPKSWKFFLGCARQATKEEFKAWKARTPEARSRAAPEPRRLPSAPADSPLWNLYGQSNAYNNN